MPDDIACPNCGDENVSHEGIGVFLCKECGHFWGE